MKAKKLKQTKEGYWTLSNGRYHMDEYDQHGRRVRKTWRDRDQACREYRTIVAAIANKTYVNPNSECATFAAFVPVFHKKYTGRDGKKPRTNSYEIQAKSLLPFFGHIPVSDHVDPEVWRTAADKYTKKMDDAGHPKRYAKNMRALKTMLNFAVRLGHVTRNPLDVARIVIPSAASPGRIDYFTKEQFSKLLEAAPAWLVPMIRFAVATGFRLKEVTGLKWEDVDHAGGLVHTTEDSKVGKAQSVRMCEESRAVLAERKRHMMQHGHRSEYVFANDAGIDFHADYRPVADGVKQPCRKMIAKAMRSACDSIGKPGASFHTLRHTCASWAVQAGVPLLTVKEVMRHSSIVMTEIYAHLAPDQHEQAMRALDAAFAAAR